MSVVSGVLRWNTQKNIGLLAVVLVELLLADKGHSQKNCYTLLSIHRSLSSQKYSVLGSRNGGVYTMAGGLPPPAGTDNVIMD